MVWHYNSPAFTMTVNLQINFQVTLVSTLLCTCSKKLILFVKILLITLLLYALDVHQSWLLYLLEPLFSVPYECMFVFMTWSIART